MLASVAQHQREKNAEQTHNRMKGRMMNGYAVFTAPIGYRYEKAKGHGKLLVRDEPVASIIQEGLEAYASGRIASQAELRRFFEAQPAYPKDLPNGQIRQQRISDLIARVICAGYLEHDPWGVTRRRGHHEPIISLATFEKIQTRKNTRPIAVAKQNIHEDFPLRGAINCACCNQPMTACWSRSGTGKRYPYYWCQMRDCVQYRKSIRAEKIDAGFEELLKGLTPSQNLLSIVTSMLSDAWDPRAAQRDNGKAQIKRDIAQLDKQQDALLEKLVDATNAKVVTAYESKIAKLEDEKLLLSDKLTQNSKPKYSKAEIFELLKTFLSNPWSIWEKGNLLLRKNVLRMTLKEPLAYDRKTVFELRKCLKYLSF